MFKNLIAVTSIFAFAASSACAQDTTQTPTQTEDDGFSSVDSDASGSISLDELQAAKPDTTPEAFAIYDLDANGELSQDEFSAWINALSQPQ